MATNNKGMTPLHLAAWYGKSSTTQLLLRINEVDIEAKDSSQATPLMGAAHRGHPDIVQMLLDYNANMSAGDWEGDTALHGAVSAGRIGVVNILLRTHRSRELEARNVHEQTPLHRAAEKGMAEILQLLLQFGANKDALDNSGWTPLHSATASGQYDTIQALLQANADPNHRDKMGRMPLHIAASSGYLAIVQLLQRFHGNIRATHHGGSILHDAVRGKNTELLHNLLPQLKPVTRCAGGYTALHLAAACYPESVPLLLQFGADIHARGPFGRTALHWAAAHGNTWTINKLLDGGASIYSQDSEGSTPYDVAGMEGFERKVPMLDTRNARHSRQDSQYITCQEISQGLECSM